MESISKEQRSKIMRSVKSKNTKIERVISSKLWMRGYRYRRNYSKIIGTPDFAFTKIKLAVFCDSEFWHGKDWNPAKPKINTNQEFWTHKIEKNIFRDKKVNDRLNELGWTVLRFWGKNIMNDTDGCVSLIESEIIKLKATCNNNR